MEEKLLHPFWNRGFRPFFLAGSLFSVLILPCWALIYAGWVPPTGYFADPLLWHAHEMIFGFTLAIIAGFLLTAVANWTGWSPVRGGHLAALVAVWAAGRVVLAFGLLPGPWTAAVDLAFIPFFAVSLFVPLWRSRNIRNFVFLVILSGLFLCNLGFYLTFSRDFILAALFLVMTVVSVVGGRVVPSFTVAWLRYRGEDARQKDAPVLDAVSLVFFVVLAALAIGGRLESPLAGIVGFVLCAVQLLRLSRCYPFRTFAEPMLWILHAGFLWMATGLFMLGLAGWGIVPLSIALHALTTGAIGSFVIGMICRVSLGHTGREIKAGKATVSAFLMIQAAALIRVFAGLFIPELYVWWIGISAVLWALAFAIFIIVYAPVLWKSRADGLFA